MPIYAAQIVPNAVRSLYISVSLMVMTWLGTLSTFLALLGGNHRSSMVSPKWPVMRSFEFLLTFNPHRLLSKQWRVLVIWDAMTLVWLQCNVLYHTQNRFWNPNSGLGNMHALLPWTSSLDDIPMKNTFQIYIHHWLNELRLRAMEVSEI